MATNAESTMTVAAREAAVVMTVEAFLSVSKGLIRVMSETLIFATKVYDPPRRCVSTLTYSHSASSLSVVHCRGHTPTITISPETKA